ncbi:MAG: hypothetical protein HOE62_18000 [Alphaproteobacteria bacterium]|jgi:hypothetical protein|nr:hypothetical protein [Alphaproteobacteria bacterium]MBT4966154.1 hypothetical protein [Alphaproteobacteria bacterium]MBT5158653.1 hypothetical protein [Alphaproteobacteria bacterium]MBT6388105.1 hypothetical protein [Alphaproteobacteria bacterium]
MSIDSGNYKNPIRSGATKLVFAAVTVLFASTSVSADEIFHDGSHFLSGAYRLGEFRATGIYSGEEEAQARKLIGLSVQVHGDHVALPTGELCHVMSTDRRMLKDDRGTFGSSGGSWSQAGLKKLSEEGYEVAEIGFDCAERFWGMLVQPETETYLLKVWAVYLTMHRY